MDWSSSSSKRGSRPHPEDGHIDSKASGGWEGADEHKLIYPQIIGVGRYVLLSRENLHE